MKTIIKIFLFAVCFIMGKLNAQDIQLTVIATPPHPSLLSEFQQSTDNYRVNIINTNQNQEHNIMFKGRLTSDNGIEAELSDDFNDYQILNIPAGSNETYLFEELGNLFGDLTIDDIIYSGGPDVAYLIQSQRLPDGVYNICLEARDFDSRELLSLPIEANCSNPIIIQSINPPTIVSPVEDEVIDQVQPTFFNINWTPVVAPSASIIYDIRIAEYNDIVNAYDAIEDANFIQFEETDLRTNFFSYNQSHTPLVEGRRYIVRVRARDENNSVNIFNQGWSEIVIFTFGGEENQDDNNGEIAIEGDFSCLSPCVSIDIPDVPSISSIAVGDIFKIGHFNLQIDDYQQTVSGYSGRGVIKASDFIPKDINVNFENVNINERNMITGGMVNGVRKAAMQAFPKVNQVSENSNVDELLIDRLYDELLDPAAAMISDDINETLDDIAGALSLPISFGEGAYKIHIPDMTFTAEGAQVSMLSGYEMQGDYIEGSQKLVFGNDNICISPGGLSLTDDALKLDILTPQDFQPSEVFSVHINGAEGVDRSYINIDCDGINEIVLNGHISFDKDYVLGVNNNGDVQTNKKFATSYHASFTDWNEMIFTTHNDVEGTQGDLFFGSSFEVNEFPEFRFNFDNMVIDLSESDNAEGMNFPFVAEQNWTGTYIKNIQLQLPDYFEQGENPINLASSDFIIDNAGVSFDFTGSNLESLTDISLGGWAVDIQNLRLSLIRNLPINSSISGEISLPICEEPIFFGGRMQRADNQMDYSLTFDVREKWEVPMWACKFRCNSESRLVADRVNGDFVLKAMLSGDLELNDAIGDFDGIKIRNIRFEDMEFLTEAPYFKTGNFDVDAVINAQFYGFNINLEDIAVSGINVPNIQGELPQLSFDLGFKFGSKGVDVGGMYFSTNSRLNLTAMRNVNTGKYSFRGIELERIEIESQMPAIQLDGHIDLYNNHHVYGDGFGGVLRARLLGMGTEIETHVLFGNKSNYDYWRVNAGLEIPQGVALGPIQIKGLSGGAFYNMNQTIDHDRNIGEESVTYEPRKGGWGFSAGAVWATIGSDNVLNGNVNLAVDFQPDGGLNNIVLDGMAKMMDDPSFSRNNIANTEMLLKGIVSYNHAQGSLNGSFGYNLNIPRFESPLKISKNLLNTPLVQFNIDSPNDWNFNLGMPRTDGGMQDMLGFDLLAGINIRGNFVGITTSFSGYFNMGTSIPAMPPLPPRARAVTGDDFPYNPVNKPGVGNGLHVAFETGKIKFGYDIAGLEISAYAGLGYDISLQHKQGLLCNGRANFGMNQWYMEGRAYIYAGGSLYAKVFGDRYHLLSASVGAGLTFAGPDPFFIAGRLKLRAKLPFIGTKSMYLGVSMGERCEFTAVPDQDVAFLNELAGISVLEELSELPEGDIDFTDNNVRIRANFFMEPEISDFETFSDGSMINYKIAHHIEIKENVDGQWVRRASTNGIKSILSYGGTAAIYLNQDQDHQRILKPGRDYKIIVTGTLKYRNDFVSQFKNGRDQDDQILRVQREFSFSTINLGEFDLEILDIIPESNQKNLHVNDLRHRAGILETTHEIKRRIYRLGGGTTEIKFKFTEYADWNRIVPTGFNFEVRGGFIGSTSKLEFNLSQLRDDKVYRMEVFLDYEGENPIRLHYQFFSTSKYRTLDEKLEHLGTNNTHVSGNGPNGDRYTIGITGNEGFQSPHENLKIKYFSHAKGQWDERRKAMELFAEEKGYLSLIQVINPEFTLLPTQDPGGGGLIFANPNFLDGINLNLDGDNNHEPVILRYQWRPNDYMAGIRSYALQNYLAEIYFNPTLKAIFYDDYEPINPNAILYDSKILLTSTNVEAEADLSIRF